MRFTSTLLAVAAAAAVTITATSHGTGAKLVDRESNKVIGFDSWATFYTGEWCDGEPSSVNYNLDNPGCFMGEGWRSFSTDFGRNHKNKCLLSSPSYGCPCENDFTYVEGGGHNGQLGVCQALPGNLSEAASYRFVALENGQCPKTNCKGWLERKRCKLIAEGHLKSDEDY